LITISYLAITAPAVLADVLVATANQDTWQDIGRTQAVSVRRVLAWAWAPARLQRASERLMAGDRAPAIHVSRYWLHGESWYVVSDGHHRTIAAQEAGKRTIRASIAGEIACEPDACYLDRASGRLWRHMGHGGAEGRSKLVLIADGWAGLRAEAALAAGVNDLAQGVAWRIPAGQITP
jgi:uncharacterized ParB-like nuclease family protein